MQDSGERPDGKFAERPNTLPWPPIIYTAAFALSWLLQGAAPLVALDGALAIAPKVVGLIFAASGFTLDLAAMTALVRHRTAILPNMGSNALVSSGVYAYTRNPIYLGNTILLIGFAIALRWGWLALAAPITMVFVTMLAIQREEKHLDARFGDAWRAYAARVRRWI
ncbi:MAG: isoprenylcysteine carboxylmethyltransferase family protein [Beijerinckiaceae bacterium]|nr:isoprenylcysteine carboxylmethyltransferase family protein [Beijerinckiaceae bacterium]